MSKTKNNSRVIPKNTDFQKIKDVIGRLLSHTDTINWSNNIKIMQKLYKQYPNIDFWIDFNWPGDFKPEGLSALLGPWGKTLVKKNWNLWEFYSNQKIKENVILESNLDNIDDKTKYKIEQIKPRPKTIKEFLNLNV